MGGGEKKKTNVMANEQYAAEQQAANKFEANQARGRQTGEEHGADLYGELRKGYGSMLNPDLSGIQTLGSGGGVSAPQYARDSGFKDVLGDYQNFATTGGVSEGDMRAAHGSFRNFINTGGIDAERKAGLEDTISQYKQFGKTGGIDPVSMARMQGGGGYEEYAKTGGVSDADRQNIRARAGSMIPAAYANATNEANRMRSVQGGYGPGASALKSKMLRGATQDASNAALNAEGAIMDRVNQGRQFGIQGLSSSELAAKGLQTGNQLSGLGGAASTESDLMKTIQSGRMFGTSGLDTSEANIANTLQRGRMFGTQGKEGIAESEQQFADRQAAANASAANAGAGSADANAKWLAQFGLEQKMAGLQGLGGLYEGGPSGEVQYADQASLANRGLQRGSSQDIINARYQANPSGWDRTASILQAGMGGAGGVMAAYGGMRAPRAVAPRG